MSRCIVAGIAQRTPHWELLVQKVQKNERSDEIGETKMIAAE